MEFQLVLLDIPQGVVTIVSAVLVVFVGALITLAAFIFRMLFSIRERLTAVEAQVTPNDAERMKANNARMEILWDWYKQWATSLRAMGAPENPMKQERWNELAEKLSSDEISEDEAKEFLSALLKREEQAREEEDLAALIILGSGIILAKWKLKEKELREQG